MSNNPEEIRTDIKRTQAEIGRDVDALAEKVDPAKAVERQKDRFRDRVRHPRQSAGRRLDCFWRWLARCFAHSLISDGTANC